MIRKIPQFLKDRGIKTILGFDYETYFDTDYTLKKMSTTEYIRHDLFKAQCLGFQTHDMELPDVVFGDDIRRLLQSQDWDRTAILAHHAHFDGMITTHHFGCTPAFYLCTLSMARPLHGGAIGNNLNEVAQYYGKGNKLPDILDETKGVRDWPEELRHKGGLYCATDVDLMWEVFDEMLPKYPEDELKLIHHTVRAYTEPVIIIDKKICREEEARIKKHNKELFARVGHTAKEIRSRKIFPELLREAGVEPPKKISPTTGKETFAFAKDDRAFQKLGRHPDQRIRDLVECKLVASSTQAQSRATRLLMHADPAFPVYLNYGKAHTFRWSGGDKANPQNLGRTSVLRKALTAPPGYRFYIEDSAQIEARCNAMSAGQMDLIEAFRRGEDIYSNFAGEVIYNHPVNKEEFPDERFVGKTSILGLGYYMGVNRFKETLELGAMGPPITLEEALYAKAVYGYRERYPKIVQQWEIMEEMLAVMYEGGTHQHSVFTFEKGGVVLPNGMKLLYPRLRPGTIIEPAKPSRMNPKPSTETKYADWTYNIHHHIYGGLLTENIIQAIARLVVAEQILRVADYYRVVLMVHDEGVFLVHWRERTKAAKRIHESFMTPPDWWPELPVEGEGKLCSYYTK